MNDGWNQIYVNYDDIYTIEYNTIYKLKIESFYHNNINNKNGYIYNFYFNNNLVVSDIPLIDYNFGSLGLRTTSALTSFTYVSIINNTRMFYSCYININIT